MVLAKEIFKMSAIIMLLIILLLILSQRRGDDNSNLSLPNLQRKKRYAVDFRNLKSVISYIDRNLEEALKEEKGMGCELPKTDPFSKEVMHYVKQTPPIECNGKEWVTCYLSKCKINDNVTNTNNVENLKCTYRDILFDDDYKTELGPYVTLTGDHEYELVASDHVEIFCEDIENGNEWKHHLGGIRWLEPPKTPRLKPNLYNVLIFGYDSASKNGFIRNLPNSFDYIKNEMQAVILEGYHVVGDGTASTLFPILTGKREIEHPEYRKSITNRKIDQKSFIFNMMKELGYQTMYLEDFSSGNPNAGTFQYRFNGFQDQPADHYLRNLLIREEHRGRKFGKTWNRRKYCHGRVPLYQYMINLTDQFLQQPAMKFCFTFCMDIAHDDFNMVREADEPTENFLKGIVKRGMLNDTLIIIMGDHGVREGDVQSIYQGKLEERLPFMAIRLPDNLIAKRPDAKVALEKNSDDVLTTPHDIYATVLDVLDLRKKWNRYTVKGSNLMRGLTLLEPIPRNRSCSEAGIEPQWCVCLKWERLDWKDHTYGRIANYIVNTVNKMTEKFRSQCASRTLKSIDLVQRKQHNKKMLDFKYEQDRDLYTGQYETDYTVMPQNLYLVKITINPGDSVLEATLTYNTLSDAINVTPNDITWINAYRNESACVSTEHLHLKFYCYCLNNINTKVS